MKPGDIIIINTTDAYDAEGVINGVTPGSKGIVREVSERWLQIECITHVGRQVVGIRPEHCTLAKANKHADSS